MSQAAGAKEAPEKNEKTLTIVLSWQAEEMLKKLVGLGVYGITKEEVAARFVDQRLIELLPVLRGR